MKYKIDFIREQFPSIADSSLKRWAHFENAGGSYICAPVMKRLRQYGKRNRVQPYYAYPASKEAGKMMDESYEVLAGILNVDEDWVHIGPSTTANAYVLAEAFRGYLKPGENIIVTNQDHEANSGYWRRLADAGIEVREWQVNEDGQLLPEGLEALLDEKTRVAFFPHVSNIIGQRNDVKSWCEKLRARDVISVVDGVSAAPHAWPDVADLGADVYFFSSYKTYGPHQGVMTIRPDLARALPNQAHGFNGEDLRKKFNPAGPDHAQVAGLAGLGAYIGDVYERHFKTRAELGEMTRAVNDLQRNYEAQLRAQLFEKIADLKTMRVVGLGDNEMRESTIALYSEEVKGAKLAKALSRHGIMAAGGNFYAPRILKAMGIAPEHGVLRVSFVHYNTHDEIKKLGKALRKIDE